MARGFQVRSGDNAAGLAPRDRAESGLVAAQLDVE